MSLPETKWRRILPEGWPCTEEEWDQVMEAESKIAQAVKELVNDMTEGLNPNIDSAVRTRLTENFRFWRE